MPTFRQDLKLGTKVPMVKTDDINPLAVTTERLADKSVTTPKLADESVTADKLAKNIVEQLATALVASFQPITNEEIDAIIDLDGENDDTHNDNSCLIFK